MGCLWPKTTSAAEKPKMPELKIKEVADERLEKCKKEVEDIKAAFESMKAAFQDEKQKYQDSIKKIVEEFEHYKLSNEELLEDKHHEIKALKSRLRHYSLKS